MCGLSLRRVTRFRLLRVARFRLPSRQRAFIGRLLRVRYLRPEN